MAARSLAEVERRETVTFQIVLLGWLAALLAAAIGALVGIRLLDRSQRPH